MRYNALGARSHHLTLFSRGFELAWRNMTIDRHQGPGMKGVNLRDCSNDTGERVVTEHQYVL